MDSATESTGSKTITNQAQTPTSTTEAVTNVMIGINPKRPQSQHQSQVPSVPTTTENAESNQQLSSPNKPTKGEAADIQAAGSSPPDFDFNLPCRFFKSTFARSLSLSNSNSGAFTVNQSKSMDFINANRNCAQLAAASSAVPNRKCSTDSGPINEGTSAKNYEILPTTPGGGGEGATVPPIPARRQNIETSAIIPTASAVNGAQHLLRNGCGMTTNRVTAGNGNGSIISATCRLAHVANAGGSSHFVRRNVCWPPPTSTSSSGEQECQLLDETDHEMKNSTGEYTDNNRFEVVDPSTNVEAVILQNQVDTLQWQLKQAETSCGMYRAVMEEVARFLDRYQRNSAYNRSDQISRSKSMHHVYEIHDKGSDSGNSSAYLRARSSTNLIDLKRMSPHSCGAESTKSGGEDHYDLTSPINSYNTFKDFTWRRSPKKRGDPKLSPSDEAEDKLNKEAFRLSRTIHNLLHTQQPDLTQHRHSLGQRIKSIPNGSIHPDATVHQKANLTAEMLFLRTMNMRDSRLSLRSSTDSSVHSTSSSSKVETDEENYSPPLHSKQCSNLCSTTEDESGFSSISSFQEIGVPLSSTMISSSTSSSHLDDTIEQGDFNLDSRNSTLKAVMHASSALNSNVGVPVANDANRWDSKTYRKNKFQRFSTLSNEDSTTVLWV